MSDSAATDRQPSLGFTGIWIPAHIVEDTRLSMTEKMLVSIIDALDKGNKEETGCFASNAYLAEKFGLTLRSVSGSISRLVEIGYVEQVGFNGRKRFLRANLSSIQEKSYADSEKIARQHSKKLLPYIKENSKEEKDTSEYASPSPTASADPLVVSGSSKRLVRPAKEKEPSNPAVHVLQRYYVQKFVAKVGTKPYMPYAQIGGNLKALLKVHTAEEVQKVIDVFFDYDKRTKFAWSNFMTAFNNLIGRAVNGGNGHKVDPDWVRQKEEMHEEELRRYQARQGMKV